ncbi:MAG: hypothetical protein EOO90_23140 [Pedobacter sp.]|nr:MAG: hypothetical protein EOO90_23140 [Pedobacter sp.]
MMKLIYTFFVVGFVLTAISYGSGKESKSEKAYCVYGGFNKRIETDSVGNIYLLKTTQGDGEVVEFYLQGNISSKGFVINGKVEGPHVLSEWLRGEVPLF